MRDMIIEWQELWVPEYKPRMIDRSILDGETRKIMLFTGCRRVGKTYLMFQIIDELHVSHNMDKKDIVYINYEDERIPWKTEVLTELLPTLVELHGERDYHLFLDEIHHIPNWDRWVRRVYDRYDNISIYLTSSSSKLSSLEIPGSLRGRTLVYEVFPLSFREFASFYGSELGDPERSSDIQKAHGKNILQNYLDFGGFPEVVLETSRRRKKLIIQDYFRTIITLDICERYGISNIPLMHEFVKFMVDQTYHSTNKTYNIMRSRGRKVGKETLLNFTRYLEDVYFTFFLEIFSPKVRDRTYYQKKVYFIDNSFINHITTKFSGNVGRQMENLVFLELLRTYGIDNLFYWKNTKGEEIDFVVLDGEKVSSLIQVCREASSSTTRKREVRSLVSGARELDCRELIVIVMDDAGEEEMDGFLVRFVSLYSWLYRVEFERDND